MSWNIVYYIFEEPICINYYVVEKEGKLSEWAQDEYVRNSLRKLVAVEANTAVSGDEIRAAASTDPYPVWIYGALITPEEPEAAPGGVRGKNDLL